MEHEQKIIALHDEFEGYSRKIDEKRELHERNLRSDKVKLSQDFNEDIAARKKEHEQQIEKMEWDYKEKAKQVAEATAKFNDEMGDVYSHRQLKADIEKLKGEQAKQHDDIVNERKVWDESREKDREEINEYKRNADLEYARERAEHDRLMKEAKADLDRKKEDQRRELEEGNKKIQKDFESQRVAKYKELQEHIAIVRETKENLAKEQEADAKQHTQKREQQDQSLERRADKWTEHKKQQEQELINKKQQHDLDLRNRSNEQKERHKKVVKERDNEYRQRNESLEKSRNEFRRGKDNVKQIAADEARKDSMKFSGKLVEQSMEAMEKNINKLHPSRAAEFTKQLRETGNQIMRKVYRAQDQHGKAESYAKKFADKVQAHDQIGGRHQENMQKISHEYSQAMNKIDEQVKLTIPEIEKEHNKADQQLQQYKTIIFRNMKKEDPDREYIENREKELRATRDNWKEVMNERQGYENKVKADFEEKKNKAQQRYEDDLSRSLEDIFTYQQSGKNASW